MATGELWRTESRARELELVDFFCCCSYHSVSQVTPLISEFARDRASARKPSFMPGFPYVVALRCIGQDLELRALKTFDLTVDGDKCVVRCGYQAPPAPTPVTLHYTTDDIEELDTAGQEKRGGSAASMEFLSIAQIFRAIGGFLDKNDHVLIGISNNHAGARESMLRLEYETREGVRVIDNRSVSAIYDMCVSMYKKRGKTTPRARKVAR